MNFLYVNEAFYAENSEANVIKHMCLIHKRFDWDTGKMYEHVYFMCDFNFTYVQLKT